MANQILLVEPAYYSKFPPIGLLSSPHITNQREIGPNILILRIKIEGNQKRLRRKYTSRVFLPGPGSQCGMQLPIIKMNFPRPKFGLVAFMHLSCQNMQKCPGPTTSSKVFLQTLKIYYPITISCRIGMGVLFFHHGDVAIIVTSVQCPALKER